jgi:hypothetical protein
MPWPFEMLDTLFAGAPLNIATVYAGCTSTVSTIFLVDLVRERMFPKLR